MAVSVLVVEDDRNIAELLQLNLEKEGYTVAVAHDGGEGVAKFRSAPLGMTGKLTRAKVSFFYHTPS